MIRVPIYFDRLPTPSLFRELSHKAMLLQVIQLLLLIGGVGEVSPLFREKGFYSQHFLIPKAKGGLRPILDLRHLNKFLKKLKFQMVILASIIPSLGPGTSMLLLT